MKNEKSLEQKIAEQEAIEASYDKKIAKLRDDLNVLYDGRSTATDLKNLYIKQLFESQKNVAA